MPLLFGVEKMSLIKKIGVIIADGDEYTPFFNDIVKYDPIEIHLLGKRGHTYTVKGVDVVSVNCGIGKANAAALAAALIMCGCEAILNFGLSGGISGVRRGETVLSSAFFEHDFDLTGLGYAPCQKPGQAALIKADEELCTLFEQVLPDIKKGTFATGDCFVSNAALRDSLRDNFGAIACDMETAAIADICQSASVPFAALRKISDDAGESAAESYRDMNTYGNISLSLAVLKVIDIISQGK